MARRRWRGRRSLGALIALALPVGALAGTGAALAAAGTAGAVASGTTLYLSPTGTDTGTCTTSGAPCKTLGFALSIATSGDTIELAAGTYKAATDPTGTSNTVAAGLTGVKIEGVAGAVVTGAGETNALVVNASTVTVTTLTFEHAGQSGLLVSPPSTATSPATVIDETISDNHVVTNDRCATTATVAARTASTNCKTPTPESDFGEGLHLMSVADSTIAGNDVAHNYGGILVTDELGPNHENTITGNVSSTNTGDCGITLAGHNHSAVYNPVFTHSVSSATYGKPDAAAGGVYTNTVSDNTVDNDGAAGILVAGGPPGTGVYHNTITGNTADGNGLAGFTLHSHAPFQDMDTNAVTGNHFVHDALHGLGGAPGDGTVTAPPTSMDQSAGIQLMAAAAPATGTTITGNVVSTSFFGIWASPHVLAASHVATNTISVTAGGTAIYSEPTPDSGYWVAGATGGVYTLGGLGFHGSVPGDGVSVSNVVGTASTADGGGYWAVSKTGVVYSFGDAQSFGTLPSDHIAVDDVVGMAATPTGGGYWLVGADGGVFSFGNATFFGSMGGTHLNEPVVGMTSTTDGHGYWLVASDGGIFSFGNATFHGSMGGSHLNKPVVGMAATPSGKGYWLVASDGGIFTFGTTTTFYGSMGGSHLNEPVVGMAATPSGKGYWLVASDGGIFSFGTAHYEGSVPGAGVHVTNVVGMATNP